MDNLSELYTMAVIGLKFLGFTYLLALAVWIFYLAVMNLKRNKENLEGWVRPFAAQILIIGVILDVALNMVATIPFLQLPKEFTLSSRMIRNKNRTDFRGRWSRSICKRLLDKFDPSGRHC